MATMKFMYTCTLLLLLLLSSKFFSCEGRRLKSRNKQERIGQKCLIKEDRSLRTTGNDGNQTSNMHHDVAGKKDDFQPTPPKNFGAGLSAAEYEEDLQEITPDYSVGAGHSTAAFKDEFRPTTPGHSPGVGHHKVIESQEGYRPTTPGHSPGDGHKAMETQENHRPTAPAHRLGVGDSVRN